MSKITELVAVTDSYEELRVQGQVYQKKTVESLVEFSYIVYMLQKKCKEDEDKDFTLLAQDYWQLSQSGAAQAAKVGARAEDFISRAQQLPASARTLYELAALPDKTIDAKIESGEITPNLTVTEAKSLKQGIKDDKKKDKEKVAPNPFDGSDLGGGPPEVSFAEDDNSGDQPPSSSSSNKKEDIIDAEYEEVKPQKKKESKPTINLVRAFDMLEIDVEGAYKKACELGIHTEEELKIAYVRILEILE